MKVELETTTLAVLISGLYCVYHNVDAIAIPESVWLMIAEKLEYFVSNWDFDVISFEEWVRTSLFIYPKPMLDDDTIKELQENSLYWEADNGNILLVVSMNIKEING